METEVEAEGKLVEIEEEMRKPRVGARPVHPTRAEIAELEGGLDEQHFVHGYCCVLMGGVKKNLHVEYFSNL